VTNNLLETTPFTRDDFENITRAILGDAEADSLFTPKPKAFIITEDEDVTTGPLRYLCHPRGPYDDFHFIDYPTRLIP